MSNQVMSALRNAITGNFSYVKHDIVNCSGELWEKKIGGDYYWQQVYHLLVSTMNMLSENTPVPDLPIPQEFAVLQNKAHYTGSHGKQMMLDLLEKVIPHVQDYFTKKDDSNLFDETDFHGNKMPLISVLQIINAHIMYHIGVFDGALRDSGAKAAIG